MKISKHNVLRDLVVSSINCYWWRLEILLFFSCRIRPLSWWTRVQLYFPKIFETTFNLRGCFHYKHCGLGHCPLLWTDTTNAIFSTCTCKDPFYDGLFGLDILKEKINKREKDWSVNILYMRNIWQGPLRNEQNLVGIKNKIY